MYVAVCVAFTEGNHRAGTFYMCVVLLLVCPTAAAAAAAHVCLMAMAGPSSGPAVVVAAVAVAGGGSGLWSLARKQADSTGAVLRFSTSVRSTTRHTYAAPHIDRGTHPHSTCRSLSSSLSASLSAYRVSVCVYTGYSWASSNLIAINLDRATMYREREAHTTYYYNTTRLVPFYGTHEATNPAKTHPSPTPPRNQPIRPTSSRARTTAHSYYAPERQRNGAGDKRPPRRPKVSSEPHAVEPSSRPPAPLTRRRCTEKDKVNNQYMFSVFGYTLGACCWSRSLV